MVEIEVLNWEKFNPRKDVSNPSWFRFEHNLFFDPDWDEFDGAEISVWLFLLSYASFKRKSVFKFSLEKLAARSRVELSKVESAFQKLQEKGCISATSRARNVDVTQTVPTRRDETIRNETIRDGAKKTSPIAHATAPVAELRDAFLESYRKEFQREYAGWGAKENGMAAKWLKSVSLETAKRLAALYPKWNDPWVTKQGHPLGILVSQYVQLDAWAQSSKQLIKKIAAGKAAESVDLKRAVDFEEMKRGLEQRTRQQQEVENLSDSRPIKKQLPSSSQERIFGDSGNPFDPEIFDAAREGDSA